MQITEEIELREVCKSSTHWTDMIVWGHCEKCKHKISEYKEVECEIINDTKKNYTA